VPWFVIYTWLPTIAQTIGLEDALTTSLILNVLLIVGALIGLVLTWSLSRRRFLISSFLLLALTLSVLAFTSASNGTVILFLFVLFSTAISAASNLVGILPAESFPTDIRSLGVGFATAMSRLGAAISTALLPIVLVSWGMRAMLLILVAVLLIGFLVSVLGAGNAKPVAGGGRRRGAKTTGEDR
jgi:predicted MFS family arabinose efflux permease